jgi:aminopeptidase N
LGNQEGFFVFNCYALICFCYFLGFVVYMSIMVRKYLSDYQPPTFLIEKVSLCFVLNNTNTKVKARLTVKRNKTVSAVNRLALVGEDIALCRVAVNDRTLLPDEYQCTPESLVLDLLEDEAIIDIETEINPLNNLRLEGLYVSDGVFCTQCEAEGFRRITYFLDRPDVMAIYTTRIESPKSLAPVLLSNGNLIEQGELSDDWHYAVWHDPYPKPCYLFALVAGDLVCAQRNFTTAEQRQVSLEVYVKAHNATRCEHALVSLAKAMRWDETAFGRCYDLDRYMIVAVDDFNMGAMENKGLNVFNARFVLADPQTATDTDYVNIDSVIAHEYFHNWTGNRVTCRDWFQLTLKEGLTVFRDQLYTEQTLLGKVKRIEDVRLLRNAQFAEDASPLKHPIQPASYVEMNNFYTATVYEKGAEVVRIYQTLLGESGFRKGMDLYFQRHDGQAVTVHEFRQAMADANNIDLSQMHAWYTQAGTPRLSIEQAWFAESGQLVITATQSLTTVSAFQPLLMPISLAFFTASGQRLIAKLAQGEGSWQGSEGVLWLRATQQQFVFSDLSEAPRLSVLRDFSVPVVLEMSRDLNDWLWQAQYDDDLFNRWEAWQQVWMTVILSGVSSLKDGRNMAMPENLLSVIRAMLLDSALPKAWLAEVLRLPSFDYLAQQLPVLLVDELLLAIKNLRLWLTESLSETLWQCIDRLSDETEHFVFDAERMGQRALKHLLLSLLAHAKDARAFSWAFEQVVLAQNMTNMQAALTMLVHNNAPQAEEALHLFYTRWQDVSLVLDKWFNVQASNPNLDQDALIQLCAHPRFLLTNPNRVRSVLGVFGRANPTAFHQKSGWGYRLLAEKIIEVDAINPQVASRLVQAFNSWQSLPSERHNLVKQVLSTLSLQHNLSKDLQEVLGSLCDEKA